MPEYEEILTTRHIVVKQATYTAPFAVGPYRGGLAHRDNGKFPSAPTSIVNFGALIFYLVVRRYSRDSLKTFGKKNFLVRLYGDFPGRYFTSSPPMGSYIWQ